MFSNLLAEGNVPFTAALAIMLAIAALEGTLVLLGGGLSQIIDSWLPDSFGEVDIDADVDVDIDADTDIDFGGHGHGSADFGHAEVESATALSRLLGWFCVGRVPVLVLLVVFLTVFGLAGLLVQSIAMGMLGIMFPAFLATVPALAIAIPSVRLLGKGIARIIPKDETDAISRDAVVGRIARITIGIARRDQPAEARVRDVHGHDHYVMVEPLNDDEAFEVGEALLVVARVESRYHVVRNTNAALVDD